MIRLPKLLPLLSLPLLSLGLLSLGLISPGQTAQADSRTLDEWAHGVWSVALQQDATHGNRVCHLSNGGDGRGNLAISVGDGGGDATFSYTPVWFRGMAAPLTLDDTIALIFDGQASPIGPEMEITEYTNEWGDAVVDAALSNMFVAETVDLLRASNSLIVGVKRDGEMTIYDSYMLNGFTATWLKAAEWCGFDPAKRFVTL
ncbi:hypothetical protein DL237_06710 [Pseudooceanicola sediminis]|uniref:Uncharacterized protein n=1 Tax=Pseudooceanicola sediminis TaxID=2211117 RepID=A0A399J5T2_9RHOB|nr:hypothetical protein [Pseudooceanicola sediminis]KAA2314714.1 hypothetical protein E0K93_10425 [Puniceibacterium sp. HSS470]RII39332.1 hypothetical protein DL237_06710 [Pseudooceanicola sediminis]|tara:strand:+ start:181606 stop:182211 length:606 start_codon:yes stop_codon:yes gene_type:complete